MNAGKSSLFNRLVLQDRALVSNVPGTTRDVVEKSIILNGIEVSFGILQDLGNRPMIPLERAGMQAGI